MLVSSKKIKRFLISILPLLIIVLTTFIGSISVKALTANGQAVINEATKHLGKPYSFGATGPNSFDCSGFTQYVYKNAANIEIGRTTGNQINSGKEISQNELMAGDLVFTDPGHVGIYIGNGQMIHAPRKGDVVKTSSVYTFWRARRIIETGSNIENLIFNADFYSNKYPDLKNAFGNDSTKLRDHFLTNGIREGRQASENFNINVYKSKYEDLRKAFGDDNEAYYNHYLIYGINEGRTAK